MIEALLAFLAPFIPAVFAYLLTFGPFIKELFK